MNILNPTKNRGEFRCSGRVGSSFATSDIRRVTMAINSEMNHECAKDREVLTICKSIKVVSTQIKYNMQQCYHCLSFIYDVSIAV